jgi:probable HAF family extracellular repeat protein
MNADGSVIIGQADDGAQDNEGRAFRWTQNEMVSLGTLSQHRFSRAKGVNTDGSVVVGYSAVSNCTVDQDTAFRWTFEEGMKSLGFLNGGNTSRARAVSGNGLVVVGTAGDGVTGEERAFRWTAQEQMVSLGTLIDNRESSGANAVNFDGSVIGGVSYQFNTRKATRWTTKKGLESIEKVLTDQGIPLAGMTLNEVTSLSASGTSFVGKGEHIIDDGVGPMQFLRHAWHAVIPRANLF